MWKNHPTCLGLAICHSIARFQCGIWYPRLQINLWTTRFPVPILSLFYIASYYLLASERVLCTVSIFTSWPDPWDIRVHADVAEASQEYLCDASKLRDRPRSLLSSIEFGRAERLAWGLVSCCVSVFQATGFLQSRFRIIVASTSDSSLHYEAPPASLRSGLGTRVLPIAFKGGEAIESPLVTVYAIAWRGHTRIVETPHPLPAAPRWRCRLGTTSIGELVRHWSTHPSALFQVRSQQTYDCKAILPVECGETIYSMRFVVARAIDADHGTPWTSA